LVHCVAWKVPDTSGDVERIVVEVWLEDLLEVVFASLE
jgi:hypothetical protein